MRRERILGGPFRKTEQRYRSLVGNEPEDCAEGQPDARADLRLNFRQAAIQPTDRRSESIVNGWACDLLFVLRQFVTERPSEIASAAFTVAGSSSVSPPCAPSPCCCSTEELFRLESWVG